MNFLIILLIVAGLAVFAWLLSRIFQYTTAGAFASAVLVAPAFYWTYKLWHNERIGVRQAAYACIAINLVILPALLTYRFAHLNRFFMSPSAQTSPETVGKVNRDMENWCREKNDARYDPVLDTCVALAKEELIEREQREKKLEAFAHHLSTAGLSGALSYAETPLLADLRRRPDVVAAASYDISVTQSQPLPALLVLCATEPACQLLANPNVAPQGMQVLSRKRLALLFDRDRIDEKSQTVLAQAVAEYDRPTPQVKHVKRAKSAPVYH